MKPSNLKYFALLFFLVPHMAVADRWQAPWLLPEGHEEEQSLREAGIEIDPESLAEAALHGEDLSTRVDALTLLSLRNPATSTATARKLLNRSDEHDLVRQTAAWVLAKQGDVAGVEYLEERLGAAKHVWEKLSLAKKLAGVGSSTGYPIVRTLALSGHEHAVEALEHFIPLELKGFDIEPVSDLLSVGQAASPAIRRTVVRTLSWSSLYEKPGKTIVPFLVHAASADPDPGVRQTAASALSIWKTTPEFKDAWLSLPSPQADPIPDAAAIAEALVSTPWRATVGELLLVLETAGIAPDSSSLITAAQTHPELAVGEAATRLLAVRRVAEAKPLFERQLAAASTPDERLEAAWSLAAQNDPEAIDLLHRELQERAPEEKIRLAVLLAGLNDPAGYPRVVELARASDKKLATQAIEALPAFLPLAELPEVDPIGVMQALVEGEPWALAPVVETLGGILREKVICDSRLEGLSEAVVRKAVAREDRFLILRAQALSLYSSGAKRVCEP